MAKKKKAKKLSSLKRKRMTAYISGGHTAGEATKKFGCTRFQAGGIAGAIKRYGKATAPEKHTKKAHKSAPNGALTSMIEDDFAAGASAISLAKKYKLSYYMACAIRKRALARPKKLAEKGPKNFLFEIEEDIGLQEKSRFWASMISEEATKYRKKIGVPQIDQQFAKINGRLQKVVAAIREIGEVANA